MKPLAIILLAPLATSSALSPSVAQIVQQPVQQRSVQQPAARPTPTSGPATQAAAPASPVSGQAPSPLPGQTPSSASNQQQGQQWVQPSGVFPAPPAAGQPPATSQQQIQAAFPPSSYGPASYAVAGQVAGSQQPGAAAFSQNGVAPIPPLAPPTNYQRAEQVVSPFSNSEIVRLRQKLDGSRKAKAYRPVRTVPRISSASVDLSPGSALPIARTLPGEMTTLVFVDATGAPWPLAAAPRVSDARYFEVEWLQGTPAVVISALSAYEDGNVTVFLSGLATPIVIKLSTGEPDSKDRSRVVDYRLDLRVPGRGPNATAPFLGPGKIALYDDVMQAFLDGLPPKDAKRVQTHGGAAARTQIWQYGDAMFVRTAYDIQTAFDQSMASGDGTRVYRLAPTPYVTLSDMGRSVTLQLDIN
jgi:intracellular multiplication protein IcmK